MALTIYFVHTITGIETMFNNLADELLGSGIQCRHISDESLIRRILAHQGLTKDTRRRFMENIIAAEQAGADIVQVTCSSVTPVIPCARTLVDIPVFSIDEPMAEHAVQHYSRIGVMATNTGTLHPSTDLLQQMALSRGNDITVRPVLCEGAYEAILSGDHRTHDQIVIDYFQQLAREVEVIVLAQASMARVVESMKERDRTVPVLTSPRMAMEALAEYIRNTVNREPE